MATTPHLDNLSAKINQPTPLREPWRSWEERQLTQIIINAIRASTTGVGPHTLCRYLIGAMDWFVAARPEVEAQPGVPADPFEVWLIERWLKEIRSDEFMNSVQAQRLMAEFERGR